MSYIPLPQDTDGNVITSRRPDTSQNIQSTASAVGGSVTVTLPATAGKRWVITNIAAGYDDPTAVGLVQLKSNTTVLWQLPITSYDATFDPPARAVNLNEAVTLTLAAKTGATAYANLKGYLVTN